MAVQKSRKSRSKRGMRRAHDALTTATLSVDPTTGTTHRDIIYLHMAIIKDAKLSLLMK